HIDLARRRRDGPWRPRFARRPAAEGGGAAAGAGTACRDHGRGGMIPMRWPAAILFALMLWPAAAMAVEPGEMLSDPALEARARDLSRQLRCMVCQNESIDDSNAPLAHDIRVLVRQRLLAGDSDRQVLDFLVARYGEFVL